MKVEPLFPVIWTNLSHPDSWVNDQPLTTEVELHEEQWRHIVTGHVSAKESGKNEENCWDDVLGAGVAGILRGSPRGPFIDPRISDAVRSATKTLGREIEASLSGPLAMIYVGLRSDQKPAAPRRRWYLVLPCGAIAIVWADKSRNSLWTSYFAGKAIEEPSPTRFREAIRTTIRTYAERTVGGKGFRLPEHARHMLPTPAHYVVEGKPLERRFRIQFVLPETWGFASNEVGAPWEEDNALNLKIKTL